MTPEREETAKFHYIEGNKFGLEFAKSLFLFNSALVVTLIGYIGAQKSVVDAITLLWIERAIAAFWLAWAVSIFLFAFGYLINMHQGNSLRAPDTKAENDAWGRAQGLTRGIYGLAIVVILLMSAAFICLLKAGGA
jgi:hypothetical protein